MGIVDTFYAFKFLQILTQDWKSMKAYEDGTIDDKGNLLRKHRELDSKEKKNATKFHRLVWKLKRIMGKLPFLRTKLGSYAAALWFLKEDQERFEKLLREHNMDIKDIYQEVLNEEGEGVPTNTTDGAGVRSNLTPNSDFGGLPVYDVSSDTFMKCRHDRKKYGRWQSHLAQEDEGLKGAVKGRKPVILRDKNTKAMIYLHKD